MNFWYQKPSSAIRDQVRTILVVDGSLPMINHTLPLFTNAMPAFLCRICKDRPPNIELTLNGKSIPASTWDNLEDVIIIAFFFYPFTLSPVFGTPAKSLTNGFELVKWNSGRVNTLKARIISETSIAGIVDALDHFISFQVAASKRESGIIRFATDELMIGSGPERLTEILRSLKINKRTFQRLFKKYVGITASQYRRVCKFEESFRQVKGGRFDSLTEVAFDNGFSDQSHFIRTFKEFTNLTPQNYLRGGLHQKK